MLSSTNKFANSCNLFKKRGKSFLVVRVPVGASGYGTISEKCGNFTNGSITFPTSCKSKPLLYKLLGRARPGTKDSRVGRGVFPGAGFKCPFLCSGNPSYSNNSISFGFSCPQERELFVRRNNLTLTKESSKFPAWEFIAVFQECSFPGHA